MEETHIEELARNLSDVLSTDHKEDVRMLFIEFAYEILRMGTDALTLKE